MALVDVGLSSVGFKLCHLVIEDDKTDVGRECWCVILPGRWHAVFHILVWDNISVFVFKYFKFLNIASLHKCQAHVSCNFEPG